MGQERLSDLSLLSIEVEILEKLKSSSAVYDLINQFAEIGKKRIFNLKCLARLISKRK